MRRLGSGGAAGHRVFIRRKEKLAMGTKPKCSRPPPPRVRSFISYSNGGDFYAFSFFTRKGNSQIQSRFEIRYNEIEKQTEIETKAASLIFILTIVIGGGAARRTTVGTC